MSSELQSPAVHSAIARAKQEWESTVDALAEVVCVVDSDCNVVRTNRAIESWGLGGVREVQGRNVHHLLHPRCNADECELARRLEQAWHRMRTGGCAMFELRDAVLGRVLNTTLRTVATTDLAVIVLSDITTLHNIQADLKAMNEQLETRIETRTRELNASRDELSMLSAQLMTAQENERKRIAQELHDGIGQSLSAIKYSLERAVEMANNDQPAAPAELLRMTIRRVQQTLESIRSIAMNLRPSLLDDLGAVSAVRWLCREFGEIYAPLRIHTDIAVTDSTVPEPLATPIFRTVQESLNNVARHAQASNAMVSMHNDESRLMLQISDDGVGFDPREPQGSSAAGGHGLSGLRERAAKTGGTFSLQSKRGCGTVVRVGWPLAQRGFTLLELLVVMVIIGLLAGFVAPRYFAQVGKSQVKAARAQIDAFDKALDQYRLDLGRYPTTEEGLGGLMNAPPGEPGWSGPYLKKAVPLDPWGHPYVYVSPGEHADVDLISYGKDGQPGGTGENADVTNW
ncbi:MAG TPA: type II secretion system major pseudopilin GspG [Steroidobacteraceae bacterium]